MSIDNSQERRSKKRIRFSWPLWFGYDDNGDLFRGQVVDLSQEAISFSVNDSYVPSLGDHVFTRFSYPLDDEQDFNVGHYMHWSEIIRVEHTPTGATRIAMRLHEPLGQEFLSSVDEDVVAIST
jgi:hypothetical protein